MKVANIVKEKLGKLHQFAKKHFNKNSILLKSKKIGIISPILIAKNPFFKKSIIILY